MTTQIIEKWEGKDCKLAFEEVREIRFKRILRALAFKQLLRSLRLIKSNPFSDLPGPIEKIAKRYSKSHDFRSLFESIDKFIIVGFNRKADLENEQVKVKPIHNNSLFYAVFLGTLIECLRKRPDWDTLTKLNYEGVTYDTSLVFDGLSNNRDYRNLVSRMKQVGWHLHQDDKIITIANLWYQSRVVYSGPEEFCRESLLNGKPELNSANVSNDIRECDKALGYPRIKLKGKK